jgi:FkbM family methyltransferase
MRRIWDTLPYWDESDMLRMHLEEVAPFVHKIIITEARTTFRGDPKPLYFDPADFPEWADKIIHVVADIPETDNPWVREFAQRDAAWQALLDAGAKLDDLVIIGDTDEIPSRTALRWRGWPACALQMRTALFAADWVVPDWYRIPTQTVMATVRWLSTGSPGGNLAEVRQHRHELPVLQDGGWHFSWLGGPEKIAVKLDTGTSHTEIAGTLEDALIRSGMRYTHGASGPTGAPVEPAVVDGSWPAMIRDRRCPPEWFRPEGSEKVWVRQASSDPVEIMDYLWSGYKPGTLAFEVGANDGQSIPRMTEKYGRVVAFEPYLPNYQIASMTPGSDVRLAAVSDHDGEVTLILENSQLCSPAHEAYTRLGLAENGTFTVPCVTLDTVMDAEGVPDFINMDIEGHELAALTGATRLVAECRTEWLIEFHSWYQQEACAKLLDEAGYDVTIVRHPHYAPGSEFYYQHGWLKVVPHAAD